MGTSRSVTQNTAMGAHHFRGGGEQTQRRPRRERHGQEGEPQEAGGVCAIEKMLHSVKYRPSS